MADDERWRRLESIYHEARDRTPDAREAFLDRACADDRSLRSEIESLLALDGREHEMLNQPARAPVAPKRTTAQLPDIGPTVQTAALELLESIGAGGMGEVYRARDLTLGRDVAVKVLPEAFARDPVRLARFAREAQVLASLNHPNIASIYGVAASPAGPALVLEYVAGPTLADRIADGLIPLDEALGIARQIAEALEYAHDRGVVHRDLKPANVKIRAHDGVVKILDFGLAKGAADGVSLSSDVAGRPPPETMPGMVLGTPAYMSPEQARGSLVDRRSDIWAFGAVMYEALSGRRVFGGDSAADTLAQVMSAEPDWAALPRGTPTWIRSLLARCLDKDSRTRLQAIGEARIAIEGNRPGSPPMANVDDSASGKGGGPRWFAVIALVLLAAIGWGGLLRLLWRNGVPLAEPLVLSVTAPAGATFVTPMSMFGLPWLALSPDGRTLAFVASSADGRQQLWTRRLAADVAMPLANTDGATAPFWSPDSRYVAFFAQGKLKYVDAAGGTIQTVTDAPGSGAGGSWNQNNTVIFAATPRNDGLRRARIDARKASQPLTHVDTGNGQLGHAWPAFLSDGRHFLYGVVGSGQWR